MKLSSQIIVGLLAGVLLGATAHLSQSAAITRAVLAVEPIGTIFIRLLSVVVVPLVVASLFVGIASLGDIRRLGRVGGATLAFFVVTTLVATTVGLVLALLVDLGSGTAPSTAMSISSASIGSPTSFGVWDAILALIPSGAAVPLLPLVFVVCLFSAAATVVKTDGIAALIGVMRGLDDLSIVVINWIMRAAPFAVCALIAGTIAKSGFDLLGQLATYAAVVVAALAIHTFVVLLPYLRMSAGMGPFAFFRKTSDAISLAFGTASSIVALPVSLTAARRLGVPDAVASFVLPVGATMNKNGAAVYKAVTAVFVAHLYGVHVGAHEFFMMMLASTAAAFVGAGIPGSSLVTTMIVLNAIGLGDRAPAAIALVAGIDRPLDMCRTVVNTIGNLVGAVVVGRYERRA